MNLEFSVFIGVFLINGCRDAIATGKGILRIEPISNKLISNKIINNRISTSYGALKGV